MIVGVRRQTKSHWERRSPLTPEDVAFLVRHGLKVVVQPSRVRIFADSEFLAAGAEIAEDLSPCSHIVGIKEVPPNCLLPSKTYLFFSHTFKGQPHNMPMLNDVLKKGIKLFDYELIKNQKGQRLIAFGRFAGVAGTIDILCGLGRALITRGLSNEFLKITLSYTYEDLDQAYSKIRRIGQNLAAKRIDSMVLPFVFVVTGRGRCAQGALQVLQLLPHAKVGVADLPTLAKRDDLVYICVVNQEDIMVNKENKYSKDQYRKSPQNYKCLFEQLVLPYTTCLVHCIYWEPRYPTYISQQGLKQLALKGPLKLLAISDVTCDIEGSIKLLDKSYTPDNPFFSYDPLTERRGSWTQDLSNKVLYQGCDFLPCELSHDASRHFSSILKDFLVDLSKGTVPQHLQRAVIAEGGRLRPAFQYLQSHLDK